MPNALISVVIPCFNIESRSELLYQAIRSVLQQSYPNLEIIIVDDASSDNTQVIIQEYLASLQTITQNISYTKLSENGGTSLARNHGIRLAKGQLISFLDFDDLYLPTFLEKSVEQFRKNPGLRWILACSLFYKSLFGLNKAVQSSFPGKINEIQFEDLIGNFIATNFPIAMGSGLICSKELFQESNPVYFDSFLSKRTAEDVLFGYQILLKGYRPYILEEPLVIHRTYYGELSRSSSAFINMDEEEVYEYIYKQAIEPLYHKIKGTITENLKVQIESNILRIRSEFKLKSAFLKGQHTEICKLAFANSKNFKTLLRLWLLKLSLYFPFSLIRDMYLFFCSKSCPRAKGIVTNSLDSLTKV